MAALVTCPHCSTVCNVLDGDCHGCGKALRNRDGRIALTAAAALLGLTMAGCGDQQPVPAPAYGGPPMEDPEPMPEVTDPPVDPPAPAPTTTTTPSVEAPVAPAYGGPPIAPPQTPQQQK